MVALLARFEPLPDISFERRVCGTFPYCEGKTVPNAPPPQQTFVPPIHGALVGNLTVSSVPSPGVHASQANLKVLKLWKLKSYDF